MAASLGISITQGTQDIANNRTYVTVKVYVTASGSTWNGYDSQCTGSLSGTFSGSWSKGFSKGATTTLFTKSAWVSHNSNGTKSVSFSASYKTGTSAGTISASASKTLSTIPRVSTLALSASSVAAGGSITATGTKKSSSFTDTIVLKFGSHSQTLTSGTAFTIPLSWLDAIPNATSGTATVTLTTKSGSTTIGSTSKTFTITVPGSVVPSITSVTPSEASSTVTDNFSGISGNYLKLLSQVLFEIVAEGIYGSSISSYKTTFDGITYAGSEFTSGVIRTAGTLSYTTTVTDSRGRTASEMGSITVIDYEYPTLIDVSAKIDGTTMTIVTKGKIAPVANGSTNYNTKALVVAYKKSTATTWTTKTLALSDYDFSSSGLTTTVTGVDATVTYDVKATLTDKVKSSVLQSATGITALSLLAGGKGAAFFGEASLEGLVIYGGELYLEDDELEAAWEATFGS